jgi:hypothetical protein
MSGMEGINPQERELFLGFVENYGEKDMKALQEELKRVEKIVGQVENAELRVRAIKEVLETKNLKKERGVDVLKVGKSKH